VETFQKRDLKGGSVGMNGTALDTSLNRLSAKLELMPPSSRNVDNGAFDKSGTAFCINEGG